MIELLLVIVIVAFALFLFNRFFPGDPNIKAIVNYVVIFVIVIVVILALLRLFGIYTGHLHFD